jgi:hypothetical protein
MERIDDKTVQKKVERVYDVLYSSPVKSSPELESMEVRIQESLRALESAISAGNGENIVALAETLEAMVNERQSVAEEV